MRDSMPATLLFLFLSLALLGTTILASEFSDTWEESTGVQQIQLASSDMNEALAKKQGMNANAKVPRNVLDQFTSTSSWFYTYALEPDEVPLAWGQDNEKEFVPLINLKQILPKTHPNRKCTFRKDDGKPMCTVEDLVGVLERTKASVKTEYLMGFNEPYSSHSEDSSYAKKGAKSITGAEGAEWWRLYIQPAAQQTGLKLVSPTTGISSQKVGWLIDFLAACYDNKDQEENPCDVELIKVYSVHEYKCYAGYWRKYAASDEGENTEVKEEGCKDNFKPKKDTNIYTSLKNAMREKYPEVYESFWEPYFNEVKLWVTETSCSGDLDFDKRNTGVTNLPETPTAQQSCKDITAQSCNHGKGSVQTILDLDNIERFSWFTLFPNPPLKHPNYKSITAAAMVNAQTVQPAPIGRAFLNAFSKETNCDEL